jgi:hypothetical protein
MRMGHGLVQGEDRREGTRSASSVAIAASRPGKLPSQASMMCRSAGLLSRLPRGVLKRGS